MADSDYTKVTNFTAKDTNNDTILGSDFQTEFSAVQTMSTKKMPKVTGATADNLSKLTGTGEAADSGLKAGKTPQVDSTVTFEKDVVFNAVISTSGGSGTITWTSGNKQARTMTSNGTLTFVDPSGPCNLTIKVTNSGGARTITWPAAVKWPGGNVPTPSASGKVDIYMFLYDGTTYYGSAVSNY